jgi:YkoY family integral membrane protein
MFSPETLNLLLVGLNLVLIESLLSIDNAAVLAGMVQHLPEAQSRKALKWGMGGAYVFRGLALYFAGFLMKFFFLKILGGLYLLYLSASFFHEASKDKEEKADKPDAGWKTFFKKNIWGTILLVEIMDMAFSIDNVFAAVALTKNMYVIIAAVCVGITAMRFVAQRFVDLMQKYPFLERVTFIVIALLGIKLVVSGAFDYQPESAFKTILNSHAMDLVFSIGIVVIFAVPVLVARQRAKKPAERVLLHS